LASKRDKVTRLFEDVLFEFRFFSLPNIKGCRVISQKNIPNNVGLNPHLPQKTGETTKLGQSWSNFGGTSVEASPEPFGSSAQICPSPSAILPRTFTMLEDPTNFTAAGNKEV